MPEQVLVTGAAGFIGSHLTTRLLELRGYDVVPSTTSLQAPGAIQIRSMFVPTSRPYPNYLYYRINSFLRRRRARAEEG